MRERKGDCLSLIDTLTTVVEPLLSPLHTIVAGLVQQHLFYTACIISNWYYATGVLKSPRKGDVCKRKHHIEHISAS